jgi:hypothetical protein
MFFTEICLALLARSIFSGRSHNMKKTGIEI